MIEFDDNATKCMIGYCLLSEKDINYANRHIYNFNVSRADEYKDVATLVVDQYLRRLEDRRK